MNNANSNAFPLRGFDDPQVQKVEFGLSKREWFAGQIMAATYARDITATYDDRAEAAVLGTDALISALKTPASVVKSAPQVTDAFREAADIEAAHGCSAGIIAPDVAGLVAALQDICDDFGSAAH